MSARDEAYSRAGLDQQPAPDGIVLPCRCDVMRLIGAWLQETVFGRRVAEKLGCLYNKKITADGWLHEGCIKDVVA
jgi:hypothetical protein